MHATSSIRQERRPAPSSHQTVPGGLSPGDASSPLSAKLAGTWVGFRLGPVQEGTTRMDHIASADCSDRRYVRNRGVLDVALANVNDMQLVLVEVERVPRAGRRDWAIRNLAKMAEIQYFLYRSPAASLAFLT
jgi:hypothetical protein